MSGFSDYSARRTIDFWLQSNSLASNPPANKYLALFFADPTDANITANEVTGAWYARQLCNSWNVTGSNVAKNSNQIAYDAVTDAAVTVTHWALYDAITGGNMLASGAAASSKLFNIADICVFNAGQLELDFD